jgi:hypothetical protein
MNQAKPAERDEMIAKERGDERKPTERDYQNREKTDDNQQR